MIFNIYASVCGRCGISAILVFMKIQKFATAPRLSAGIDGFDTRPGNGLAPARVDLLGAKPGKRKTATNPQFPAESLLILEKHSPLNARAIRQFLPPSWGFDVGAEVYGFRGFCGVFTREPAYARASASVVPAATDSVQPGRTKRTKRSSAGGF